MSEEITITNKTEENKPVPQTVNNTIVVPEQKAPTLAERVDNKIATALEQSAETVLQRDDIKDKIDNTITTIVEKKADTAVNKVIAENNESASELEEEALSIFGYKPGKSIRKWQSTWASHYHAVLSAIWMALAMFTAAPVIFVAKKIHNAGKITWFGIILGVIIYGLVIALPLLGAKLIGWLG